MKHTTIWLDQKDRDAIKTIRAKYGQQSDSAAIRFALRVLASQELQIRTDTVLIKED